MKPMCVRNSKVVYGRPILKVKSEYLFFARVANLFEQLRIEKTGNTGIIVIHISLNLLLI